MAAATKTAKKSAKAASGATADTTPGLEEPRIKYDPVMIALSKAEAAHCLPMKNQDGLFDDNETAEWAKWYQDGRPVRESTGVSADTKTPPAEARRILKEREGRVAAGIPVLPRADRVRYEEAAGDLRRALPDHGYSGSRRGREPAEASRSVLRGATPRVDRPGGCCALRPGDLQDVARRLAGTFPGTSG